MRKVTSTLPVSLLAALLALALPSGVFGQQQAAPSIDTDEGSLFGGSPSTGTASGTAAGAAQGGTEAGTQPAAPAPAAPSPSSGVTTPTLTSGMGSLLLRTNGTEIGGTYFFSASPTWTWTTNSPLSQPAEQGLNPTLGVQMFFDAKPQVAKQGETFHVYGKFDFFSPFAAGAYTSDFSPARFNEPILATDLSQSFKLEELFADFNWGQAVWFRAGKQTVKWGVGYFFSPADVLSLTAIDPSNPTAAREGPIALKTQVPFGQDNFYLYTVASSALTPQQVAWAPKLEIVLGNAELAVAGYYRPDMVVRPRAMLMASFPVWIADVYGEAVGSYGSERNWVQDQGGIYSTYTDPSDIFFQGTIGFSVRWNDSLENWNLTLNGQYYYNGQGYQDPSMVTGLVNTPVQLLALETTGGLLPTDLVFAGRHYAAASAGLSKIMGSGWGLSLTWVGNLSDGSGEVAPGVSYIVTKDVTVSLSAPYWYGATGTQFTTPQVFGGGYGGYSVPGTLVAPSLSVTLWDMMTVSAAVPVAWHANSDGSLTWESTSLSLSVQMGMNQGF
jgi:hypothetical protein